MNTSVLLFETSGSNSHTDCPGPFAPRRTARRSFLVSATAALLALLTLGVVPAAVADKDRDDDHDQGRTQWVATWATSPAAYFVYVAPLPQNQALAPAATRFTVANIQPDLAFPFPNANTTGAHNQTIRSIVKPDLWGDTMRVRFSNVFGNLPLTFDSATIALQEYAGNAVHGTVTPVTFRGSNSVTIPAGQEMWSDAVHLSWVKHADDSTIQGRNLAISYSIQGDSGHMTYHSGANTTSFITPSGSGNHTWDADGFAYEYTTTSWFFLASVDVLAPTDTVVVCAFGDSITDGTHTTLNTNDRWANVLSRRLHNAYGNKVSVVNEAIGGNRVINPVVANAASGPAAVDRLDRDVLGLSGLTHVIWLEGINDLGAGYGAAASPIENPVIHTPSAIIAGYRDVVARLHARGIKVHGATVVSALGLNNPAQGWDLVTFPSFLATVDNGPVVEANRLILNQYIRAPGNFDGVVDFDAATRDPNPAALGNMKPAYLPNSQFTQLPWDYLHPNHAGYNAMGMAIDIAPFAPAHHKSHR
jgi:lysophospholipase L1-like esterase